MIFFSTAYYLKHKWGPSLWSDPELALITNQVQPYSQSFWRLFDPLACLPWGIALKMTDSTVVLVCLLATRIPLVFFIFRSCFQHPDLPRGLKIFLGACLSYLVIHLIGCSWADIYNIDSDLSPETIYNLGIYWTITTLTTIGYGDITPDSNTARVFTMIVMIAGVGSYGLVIGGLSRMIIRADQAEEEKKRKVSNLQEFLKHYQIPQQLRKQIFSFYLHLLEKNLSDRDEEVIKDLPQSLKQELQVFMQMKLIRELSLFADQELAPLKAIARKLEQQFYSPGEFLIQEGEIGKEMFILSHGEVEILGAGEKTVAILEEGSFFGEMALIEDTVRNASVRARSYCDLYQLSQEDFIEICEKFPKLKEKLLAVYQQRKSA